MAEIFFSKVGKRPQKIKRRWNHLHDFIYEVHFISRQCEEYKATVLQRDAQLYHPGGG